MYFNQSRVIGISVRKGFSWVDEGQTPLLCQQYIIQIGQKFAPFLKQSSAFIQQEDLLSFLTQLISLHPFSPLTSILTCHLTHYCPSPIRSTGTILFYFLSYAYQLPLSPRSWYLSISMSKQFMKVFVPNVNCQNFTNITETKKIFCF